MTQEHVCPPSKFGLPKECLAYIALASMEGRDVGEHNPPSTEFRCSCCLTLRFAGLVGLTRCALHEAAPDMHAALELAKHKIQQTLEGQYKEGQALRAAMFVIENALEKVGDDDV